VGGQELNDGQRKYLTVAYTGTRPGDDMPIPEDIDVADAMIFVAHLQEIGYGCK
jgi:hypothetical protein